MTTLDELKSKAQGTKTFEGETDILILGSDASDEQLTKGLIRYFGEDDTREAIRLIHDGEEWGFLTRQTAYGFEQESSKGVGAADYGTLPGLGDYQLIQLRCPVPGCSYRPWVVTFDEKRPYRCQVHPDHVMEICK